MPEPLAPALERLARLVDDANQRVLHTRSRLGARRDSGIIICLQRAGDRIDQARAILGPAPAVVAPGSLEHVASSTVWISVQPLGLSNVTLQSASVGPTAPVTEWQRIAAAALISAALSNSHRHRPDEGCEVSIDTEPHQQLVIVSGQPFDDSSPPRDWAALVASELGPLAGAGLTLSAALAERAGLELRALHGAERTALALQITDRTSLGAPPIRATDVLQQRALGAHAALSEHGALSLLADVMPLIPAAPRRELARAIAALREADALSAETAAYASMQPAR